MSALLTVEGAVKRFGGLVAVRSLDFVLEQGVIASVIGPNGAGKTTFFNCIAGFYRIDEGRILLDGTEIHRLPSHQIAHLGLARTYQNIRLFNGMTTLENVLVGEHQHLDTNWVQAIFRTRAVKNEEEAAIREANRLLEFVGLKGKSEWQASSLPYGDQRRLEIARALATRPRLLLLDEPTAGMNPNETAEMTGLIRRLRDDLGITILLIEHEMRVVMGISDRITVLDYGERIAEGTASEIQQDARVIEAYLGRAATPKPADAGPVVAGGPAPPPPPPPGELTAMVLLEVNDLHVYYGSIHAIKGVTLIVNQGEIVTLIGANGAGKTTTLNTICGLLKPRQGFVRFDGNDLASVGPHHMVGRGIVQVPEGRRVFARLTVEENLRMGAFTVNDKAQVAAGIDRAYTMFPRLKERAQQLAGTLSGGEQQMLAMGRALMSSPRMLLLDEPSMGLAPNLVEFIFETIVRIHATGTSVLLVEQNALQALTIADRGYVIQSGTVIMSDTASALAANEDVRRAYLGEI